MLSVNQLNAKIKTMVVWKSFNVEGYPLKITTQTHNLDTVNTRAMTSCRPIELGASILADKVTPSDYGIMLQKS